MTKKPEPNMQVEERKIESNMRENLEIRKLEEQIFFLRDRANDQDKNIKIHKDIIGALVDSI